MKTRRTILTGILSTFIVVTSPAMAEQDAGASSSTPKKYRKWEYKVHFHNSRLPLKELNEKLNELGKEGWELTSTNWQGGDSNGVPRGHHVCFLKRPLNPAASLKPKPRIVLPPPKAGE